jgi:hypothetical protein
MELNECVMPAEPLSPSEPPPDSAQPARKRIRVRISLYFDGTGNNKKNTETRIAAEETGKDPTGVFARILEFDSWRESSYFNDLSNVARLYSMALEASSYTHHFNVYTEGIGTLDDQGDDAIGNATGTKFVPGMPDTGVVAKVEKGLGNALAALTKLFPPGKYDLESVSMDTFGFSRGAAAARYCIHRILFDVSTGTQKLGKLPSFKKRLVQAGYELGQLEVQAVGLFDTVSAFGIAYIDTSDVRSLHLDAVKQAKAVYHLAAAEEYRLCFSLTNIDSAVSAGNGCQIFLPGAHSDIGGGYVPNDSESKIVWTEDGSESIQEFLEIYGWAKVGETRVVRQRDLLQRRDDMMPMRPDNSGRAPKFDRVHLIWSERYLKIERRHISNRYSFIPLLLMAEFAREQGLIYDPELETKYDPAANDAKTGAGAVPQDMIARLKGYANRAKGTHDSLPEDWMQRDASMKRFRNRFLHFSSSSAAGMNLRTRNIGEMWDPWRRIWSDNA